METDYLLRQEALREKLMENQPTLRDQFAMAALTTFHKCSPSFIQRTEDTDYLRELASGAYAVADAMLKERECDKVSK